MKNDKYILNRSKQIFKYGDSIPLTFSKNVEGGTVEVPVNVTLDESSIPSLLLLGVIEKFSVDVFPIEEIIKEYNPLIPKDFIRTLNFYSRVLATHFLLRLCSLYNNKKLGIPMIKYPSHWSVSNYEFSPMEANFSKEKLQKRFAFTGIFASEKNLVEALGSINRFLDSLS